MKDNKLILEILLRRKLMTSKDLKTQSLISKKTKESVIELLIQDKIIRAEDLLEIFHQEWGFDLYTEEKEMMSRQGMSLIPRELAWELKVFPLEMIDEETLLIMMSDPINEEAIRELQDISKKHLKILVATQETIEKQIRDYYPMMLANQKLDDSKEKSVISLTNKMINDAIIKGASDIHIEIYAKKIQIRFRIDGILQQYLFLDKETWRALITRLKILGRCDIAKQRLPQDGSFKTVYEDRQIDSRLSLVPTIHGEKVVLRLLDQDRFLMPFEKLGFSERQEIKVKQMMKSSHGLILTSGPTGSGKTTTLYSLLNEIDSKTHNIITIEDPVEIQMEDINQIQVNEKTGLSFSMGLRSILRQDPNVIMVGEIRDEETAGIAVSAAITGHLVLSSIHTDNAVAALIRLMDMKVPLYLLSNAVCGIISQKLLRKLCPHCKKERMASRQELSVLREENQEGTLKIFDPLGCKRCSDSGYKGRFLVQEVLKITRKIRNAIGEAKDYEAIRNIALEEGMEPMEWALKEKILQGETSFMEGIKIFENDWQ